MTDRAPVYSYYIDWYGHGWLNSGLTNWAYDTTADSFTRELTSDQTFTKRSPSKAGSLLNFLPGSTWMHLRVLLLKSA
jgi:hypothetical protein